MLYETLTQYINKNHHSMKEPEINKIYNAIRNICDRNNIDINSLKYLDEGEGSIVFDCGDKIIKFAPLYLKDVNVREYVRNSEYILKPEDEEIITYKSIFGNQLYLSILLEPKLLTGELTMNDALNLSLKLLNDGYIWLDIKPRNIGIDIDGRIKLFDYGELFNRKYDNFYANHLKTFQITYTRLSDILKTRNNIFKKY